jgi:nucleoid-associated protein YgaU
VPNDAKLALVIGVGLVVAVAIIFFHKDLMNGRPAANVGNPPGAAPAAPDSGQPRRVAARPTSRVSRPAPRQHTVEEGDSLYELAKRYYGDGERFTDIYQANRTVLKRPDRLEVGTVLVIPNVSDAPTSEEPTETP